MSWSALAWAMDSNVGSSAAKFLLILLANKADENFSCHPSIRTLMAESNAGRSTVLLALRDLETRGFISRHTQFHDSGARRSTGYYLNYPVAPHLSPSPDPDSPRPDQGLPGPDSRRPPSRCETAAVSQPHTPGVPQRDTLNPAAESPAEPSERAAGILRAVTEAWKLSSRGALSLLAAVESAVAHGWPAADLTELVTNGLRHPAGVLVRHLSGSPPSRNPYPAAVPWCGECEDAHSRTITVTEPDGTEAAQFCPQCSPQVHRARPSRHTSLQHTEGW